MLTDATVASNVKQAVPFFNVTDIEASLRFYVDGLGFVRTKQWVPEGRVRWCWLQLGEAALMLQSTLARWAQGGRPRGALGPRRHYLLHVRRRADHLPRPHLPRSLRDASLCWQWPVGYLGDGPDGYRLDFESPTDVPEDTVYSG